MKVRQFLFGSYAALVLGTGIAQAGPCNTANKDAGSGPTPGQTTNQTGNRPRRSTVQRAPTHQRNKSGSRQCSGVVARILRGRCRGSRLLHKEAQGAKTSPGANDC